MDDKIVQCKTCGVTWEAMGGDPDTMQCECGGTDIEHVGDQRFMRGKELYMDDCEDIDDLIDATRARLEELEQLREEGYEVRRPESLGNDYVYLVKFNDNFDPTLDAAPNH